MNIHAAKPAGIAEKISFDVLNQEAEMIMASEVSLISPRVKDLSASKIGKVPVVVSPDTINFFIR